MNVKLVVTLAFMVIIIALAILFRAHNQNIILQGEVDAPQVIVVSKAKGRVIERYVERGDDVKAGDLLIKLEAPELIAQLKSAEAARDIAKARFQESMNGTREENIRSSKADLLKAQASYANAVSTYNRNKQLAAKGYLADLALETYQKDRDTAAETVRAARANMDLALHGDRVEQREQFSAQLREAEHNLAEIKAVTDDLNVVSPVDGEIGPIPAEVGELLNASSPLMTVIRISQAYFVFYLREDILANIKKGDIIEVSVPAIKAVDDKKIKARVGYIAPLGDFATKRATRATGDFDLKTFEVRLYLEKPIANLRIGMSVLWDWQK